MSVEKSDSSNEKKFLWQKVGEMLESDEGSMTLEEQSAAASILHSLNEEPYHFSNESIFAQGGEKTLTKAYDANTDRTVIIARPRRSTSVRDKERFLREARIACKLQHPNILPVYEIGLDKNKIPYFIMRVLDGEEFGTVIKNRFAAGGNVSLERLLEMFLKVCDAIIYAHSCGVLHLDLKPANVLVGVYGQVVLYDWGMAHVMVDTPIKNSHDSFSPDQLNSWGAIGSVYGTPGYMAPEQIIHSERESVATDVYSLGAILYKIITGSIPVKGNDSDEIIQNTREGNIVRPRERHQGVSPPEALVAVAMKALSFSPENRYQTVQEMHDDVTRYLRGYAPLAEKVGVAKRMQLMVRRHNKVATVLMGAGIFVLILFGGWIVREKINAAKLNEARIEAETNLQNFLVQEAEANHYQSELGSVALNSNFQSFIYSYPYGYDYLVKESEKEDLEASYKWRVAVALAWLEMANQNFTRVMELTEKRYEPLYVTAKKWAAIKSDDEAQLSDLQFAEFLDGLMYYPHFRKLASLSLQLHREKRRGGTPEEYLQVVIQYLNLINHVHDWGDHVRLEKREGGYHLDLTDSPYRTFVIMGLRDFFYLEPLELVSIDISGLSLHGTFGTIVVGKVDTVIMKDIVGDSLHEIGRGFVERNVGKMQTLVVSHGMFDDEMLRSLGEMYEVLLEEPNDPS